MAEHKLKNVGKTNRSAIRNPTDQKPIEQSSLGSNAYSDTPPVIFEGHNPETAKKLGKIKIRKRKKSLLSKFTETFLGEDAETVMNYLMHDVLIPAAKATITEFVSSGIEMLIYGERQGSRIQREKGRSIVSYNSYYNRDGRPQQRPENTRRDRGRRIDDLIFSERGQAEEVLSDLADILEEYDQVTVADLYDLINVTTQDFTHHNYGWTNLSRAYVERVRDGYQLNLPKTESLS